MDSPREVLPTPGGPTRHSTGPLILLHPLLDREVLDDALLHFLQAVVVLVEDIRSAASRSCDAERFFQGTLSIQSM
jgi:hypothetical protein